MIVGLFCYGFTTLYFANVVAGYFFPQQTETLRCNIGWNCFKAYTITSIYFNKIMVISAPVINVIKRSLIDYKPHYFEVVKDGLVVQKEFYNASTNFSSYKIEDNDFILYYVKLDNENNNSKYDYNVLRVDNANTINTNIIPEPMESKVSFLSISIKLPSGQSVEVAFGRNNFMMANNALFDSPFVKYYLYSYDKKYNELDLSGNEDLASYNVVTLDSNINSINFDSGSFIMIMKNSFSYQLSSNHVQAEAQTLVEAEAEAEELEVQADVVPIIEEELNENDNEQDTSSNEGNDYEIINAVKKMN